MEAKGRRWRYPLIRAVHFLILICFLRNVNGFMDMEELKSVYYGLDILSEPVVMSLDVPTGAVQVTSKYGQQYQCSFPDHTEDEKKKEEEEKAAVETGIIEMLKPMQTIDCLIKTKDWWTYEFCFGKSVRQYHMEDGEIKSNIIHLGLYESDFDWSNTSAKEERLRSALASYHSQMYSKGDICDLTGKPRKVEARFLCEENSEDYLSRIEESETCVYTVTVMTSRICRHPYLKPPLRRRSVPITCNPLLTEDQFKDYITEVNERKLAAQKYKMEMNKFQEKDSKSKKHFEMDKELEDALSATAKELLSEPQGSLFPTPDENGEVSRESFSKMFGPSEQLWELYQKGLEIKQKNLEETKKKMEELKELQKRRGTFPTLEGDEADKEDDEILSDYSEEIGDLKARFQKSRDKIANIKQRLINEKKMETNIENAIQEAEQEMGMKLDRTLVSGLSSTLKKLVDKLQDTEAELTTMDDEINGLNSKQKNKDGKLGEKEKSKKLNDDDNDGEKDVESSMLKGERLDQGQLEEWQTSGASGEDRAEQPTVSQYDDKIKSPPRSDQRGADHKNQRLKVPSTFPLPKDPNEEPVEDPSRIGKDQQEDKDHGDDKINLKEVEEDAENSIPSNIKDLLEETVKKEYEKKLVKKGSSKLGLDDDHSFVQDKSIHVIQQEDKEGNTNRFIFVLGFKNVDEEAVEQEQQSTLEENYGFVYKKQQNSGTGFTAGIEDEQEIHNPDR